jgi:hypothetical protein
MAEFVETVLALFGLVVLGAIAAAWLAGAPHQEPARNLDPYQAGLDAINELTAAAWAAEHALHQAAEQAHRREEQ